MNGYSYSAKREKRGKEISLLPCRWRRNVDDVVATGLHGRLFHLLTFLLLDTCRDDLALREGIGEDLSCDRCWESLFGLLGGTEPLIVDDGLLPDFSLAGAMFTYGEE